MGALAIVFAVFCLFFFRDFDRRTPIDDGVIYSPGDGTVVGIETESEHTVIRIFLSIFDGHVQRIPVSGTVKAITHQKGNFLDARDPRAHLENEQNTVILTTPRGTVLIKQIAGLIARRIVCWIKTGENVRQGTRFGLIRFGSQVDILFPKDAEVMVQTGANVLGGLTVLARWPLS